MRRSPSRPADGWSRDERRLLRSLRSPRGIQDFLDGLAYRAEDRAACPRDVLRERRAHCFDGALLAAAALWELGQPPLLLDLRAVRDDDHVLAVFRVDGHLGAIAKSNFAGLRYREPVHRSFRELVMSYFEHYFNTAGEKTLREYGGPLDLRALDHLGWRFRDEHVGVIAERLDALPHRALLTPAMVRRLAAVDARSMRAGLVGTRPEGLHGALRTASPGRR